MGRIRPVGHYFWNFMLGVLLGLLCVSATQGDVDVQNVLQLDQPLSKVLIAVVTAPTHYNARHSIRETWARECWSRGAVVKFFVGELPEDLPSRNEHDANITQEADMVRLSGFIENYNNLTEKTLSIFSYAVDEKFAGVMKVDDDTYLHCERFSNFMSSQQSLETLYSGLIMQHIRVSKDPLGRWYAYDQYPKETFPRYCSGGGFYIGSQALQKLVEKKDELPRIRVEDAAVGVWTDSLKLNLTMVPMPESLYLYRPKPDSVWLNPVSPSEMYKLRDGSEFFTGACEPRQPIACLCEDSPYFSEQERQKCWEKFVGQGYTDLLPRLI
eukprot:c20967_g1_i1.p1 GENE.c20967_g1_i1~~c20967_g1_i1.p1  ORF type:complete len:327 (-),score=41.03 c20967_g1_i1:70-1050(-)